MAIFWKVTMTETIQYQSHSSQSHEATRSLFVRRLVLRRRYGRLLSYGTLLGQVICNVQSNLSSGSRVTVPRRSR